MTIAAADANGQAWSEPIHARIRENPAIAAAWARGQVRQLEDRYVANDADRGRLEKAIVAISLKFQVLCRFTAYVAVDRSQVANEDGSLHRITQPVEQPEGWDHATPTAHGFSVKCSRISPRSIEFATRASIRTEDLAVDRQVSSPPAACAPPRPTTLAHEGPARVVFRRLKDLISAIPAALLDRPVPRFRGIEHGRHRPPSACRNGSNRPRWLLEVATDECGRRSTDSTAGM